MAIQTLFDTGIDVWPAVMGDLFGMEGIRRIAALFEEKGIRTRIETEYLECYPSVISTMKSRGWEISGTKPGHL